MRLFLSFLLALVCFFSSQSCGGEDGGIHGLVITGGEIGETGRRVMLKLEKSPDDDLSTLFDREHIRLSGGNEIKIPFSDLKFFDGSDIPVSDPQSADRINICCFAPFVENEKVVFYRGHGDGIELENKSNVKAYTYSDESTSLANRPGSCN